MKVEINLSETATDEAMAIAVWKSMTGMGRGRAQALFRQCVIAGLRSMKDRGDLPDEILEIIRDGVQVAPRRKKSWTPRIEDMHIPGVETPVAAPVKTTPAKTPPKKQAEDISRKRDNDHDGHSLIMTSENAAPTPPAPLNSPNKQRPSILGIMG